MRYTSCPTQRVGFQGQVWSNRQNTQLEWGWRRASLGTFPIPGASVGSHCILWWHTERILYLAQVARPSAHRKESRISKAVTMAVGEEEVAQERCNGSSGLGAGRRNDARSVAAKT